MIIKKIIFLMLICFYALPLSAMEGPHNEEEPETANSAHVQPENSHDTIVPENIEERDKRQFGLFCFAAIVAYIVVPGVAYLFENKQ